MMGAMTVAQILLLLVLLLAAPHAEAQPSCKVSKIGVMLTQVIQ
jgi:hypothetical protein